VLIAAIAQFHASNPLIKHSFSQTLCSTLQSNWNNCLSCYFIHFPCNRIVRKYSDDYCYFKKRKIEVSFMLMSRFYLAVQQHICSGMKRQEPLPEAPNTWRRKQLFSDWVNHCSKRIMQNSKLECSWLLSDNTKCCCIFVAKQYLNTKGAMAHQPCFTRSYNF